jgi:hypothetical protein
MISNLIALGKNATGYYKLKWKRGELTLETVIKMLILALLLGVMVFFIYKFIIKRIGEDTINPMIKETEDKTKDGIFEKIFGDNK